MPKFINGIREFQQEVFPKHQDLFERLSEGQNPEALFITCSDSRIDPALMTQSEPGELFVARNAGNIVPKVETGPNAVSSAIEFAVAGLGVEHIIVCGHSGCGAMEGLLNSEKVKELRQTAGWLTHSYEALKRVEESGCPEAENLDRLIEQNVILQLEHLKAHQSIIERIEGGAIKLHGWVYDIKSGQISVYDEISTKFVPSELAY